MADPYALEAYLRKQVQVQVLSAALIMALWGNFGRPVTLKTWYP